MLAREDRKGRGIPSSKLSPADWDKGSSQSLKQQAKIGVSKEKVKEKDNKQDVDEEELDLAKRSEIGTVLLGNELLQNFTVEDIDSEYYQVSSIIAV